MKPRVFMTTFFGQVTSKKNNKMPFRRRNGSMGVRMSEAARQQEEEMAKVFEADFEMQELKHEWFENRRIEVVVEIWNKDARKHDPDNQLSAILDALKKAKIFPDDSQLTIKKETCEYMGIDKDDPRAEITVYAF